MESFRINKLLQSYFCIIYKSFNKWNWKRVIINAIIPLSLAFVILCTITFINEMKEAILMTLSILIGLLFNFISSFSTRINSEHLSQNASEKINRLNLIEETSEGAFVTILLSLFGLVIILSLTIVTNNTLIQDTFFEKSSSIILSSLVLTILYQIFLMLIYMINRLRKLIIVDTNQEKKYLESLKNEELDEWEEYN